MTNIVGGGGVHFICVIMTHKVKCHYFIVNLQKNFSKYPTCNFRTSCFKFLIFPDASSGFIGENPTF